METAKNIIKQGTSSQSPLEPGFQVQITHQDPPGETRRSSDRPVNTEVPTEDGGLQSYKAAGKLEDKKALITGGDSGIGRAIALLYAMEGADSLIAYVPEEEEDAQETKRQVEKLGRTCHLVSTDLRQFENCKKVADAALEKLGRVNILVSRFCRRLSITDNLLQGQQRCVSNDEHDITDLPNEQWIKTFDTNIHPFFFLSNFLVSRMKRGDTIINCASINAYIGRPDLLDYTSTKGGKVY